MKRHLRQSDLVLWTGAVIHTLAALSLLFILVFALPARAQEDISCGGHDLLAGLQEKDPEAYARIARQAADIPNSESIFWKVEKDGVPASYLFGTMHLSDPRVVDMPEGAHEAFEAADTLIVESDEILDQQKASAALLSQPQLTTFTDGKSITDYLTPEERKLLEADLKGRGVPLFAVSKMKPWLLSSFVSMPVCEAARKASGRPFLDQKLVMEAAASGKKIVGLETLAEQLEIMASLPMDMHIKGLMSAIKDPQLTRDGMETLITLYDQGKAAWLEPVSKYLYPEDDDGFSMAEFEQKMVITRNHHMAERAADTLAKGNAFMAVGALHLSGKEGLVQLLRDEGFTLTPL
ncbi:TraB/GumN family protein [Rhizobium sp. L1K21]|uniref:TraB/GumN family protein n=1 Tax=Rhizobium sp. L1K21 TaxID=2954933 RepID=UPI002092D2C6|nr:TraB/GumN family protein [Rhizobium sp. L1K21]MCO6184898.1 TraB/GumN family protein [Rhizobium sp. L1K21]